MGPNASTRATRTAGRAAPALLGAWLSASLIACGPAITLESEGSDDGEPTAGTDSGPPPPGTATTPPTPGTTTTPPTPGTSVGPLDTGEFDTGEPWLDLPEDCSIFDQDCPDGYKCMPYANNGSNAWNDVKCVPLVDDPHGIGEPCTVQGNAVSGLDDCDAASMCWDVDLETNMGTCVAHCIGSPEDPGCPEPCHSCAIMGDGVLVLCLAACDPIAQDCPMGQACYPLNIGFACAPDASPPDAAIGSPCEYINGCPPGLLCVSASTVPECEGTQGCCSPACPVGGVDPCPGLLPGTECVPWYEEAPPPEQCLSADPGVCVTP